MFFGGSQEKCFRKNMKRELETVTLLRIDCVDLDRLVLAMDICQQEFEFAEDKYFV